MRNRRPVRIVLCLAIVLFTGMMAAGIARAQQIPDSLYSEMKWRMIGPFRAGKVNAVAGVPGNPGVYYFGANGGGGWKTTDGGAGLETIFYEETVAVDWGPALAASDPNLIFVGGRGKKLFFDIP